MDFSLCKSLLFTPATKPERFLKVLDTQANGIVIDLEDAVSLEQKDSARITTIDFLKTKAFEKLKKPFMVCVRINSIQTLQGLQDILAFCESKIFPDAFILPKVEYPQEIILYDNYFKFPECNKLSYMALIETSIGLENAQKITCSSPRLSCLAFGGADLAADLNADLNFETMLYARSRIVQAAKTRGLAVFDVPFLDIHNNIGNYEEALKVKALGYSGKFAIHPNQVEAIYKAFTPGIEERNKAQAIIDAFTAAKGNAAEINGKMIDLPVYKNALRIINLSD